MADRHLDWDGCFNVRDLGGLRTTEGRRTRRGAVVRSDAVDRLTAAGWAALWEHGVRTVIDLRNDDERGPDADPRPAGLTTVQVPLDILEDTEFWDEWADGRHGTPLYYRPFLDRFPQRIASVIAAVARAEPGGVLIHCGIGRDRTGLVTLLLLALVGVMPDDIAADYALTAARLPLLFARLGRPDQRSAVDEILARENTTAAEAIAATLTSLDIDSYLRSSGLADAELAAIRDRLLGHDDDPPRAPSLPRHKSTYGGVGHRRTAP